MLGPTLFRLLHLAVLGAVASCLMVGGCASRPPKDNTRETLIVVREVITTPQEWTTSIEVFRNGTYVMRRRELGALGVPTEEKSGLLPQWLLRDLASVAGSSAVSRVDGVPTCEYLPESTKFPAPPAIRMLFVTVGADGTKRQQ
jgi:hypothetical protein